MSSSDSPSNPSSPDSPEKEIKNGQEEADKEPVPNPPVVAPAQRDCFLDGSEHLYELLIGVEHGVPHPRRMWDGSSPLATQYICDECWQRLGHSPSE
ncbi:hypothetical protein ANO14919_097510 [Xylariales sp. No.14919]|nr:hypothetical protein ANO14919_097510 [Xylariales sp. No.14919]